MASLVPFKALQFRDVPGADLLGGKLPLGSFELHALTAPGGPDRQVFVDRWREQGLLVETGPESFYVLELAPAREAPARFLLGLLDPDERSLELESGPERPAHAPLAPIVGLAEDDQGVLRALIADAVADQPTAWQAKADGLSGKLWRLRGGRALQEAVEEARVRTLAPLPREGSALAAIAPLSDPGLRLQPIHRGIRGLHTFQPERFLTVVSGYARIYELAEPLDAPSGLAAAKGRLASLATGTHAVLLVLPDGSGRILRFRQALDLAHVPAAPRNPTLRSLDLALLQALVFRTVLGLSAPEAPEHPHIVAVPALDRLVEAVRRGELQAGFALNPPPLWEVRAVIEAGQKLPPRTVAVSPSPPAGLLFVSR